MHEAPLEISNFVDLLRWRATHQQDLIAYQFLRDGEGEEDCISYLALDIRARAIAAVLQSRQLTGQRALLLYQSGIEYIAAFLGCLFAGVVAVPVPAPHALRSSHPRLLSILVDAQPVVALTTASYLPAIQALPAFGGIALLATDNIQEERANSWQKPILNNDTLAFLQYTSGSTSTPKGVMVAHGNLMHNQQMIYETFRSAEAKVIVGWLPFYHDMGLIGNILHALFAGLPCILMPPVLFLQRPLRWLQTITRYQGVMSGGPNFAYDLCVNKTTPEQRLSLDLSGWEIAFNGAEPVRAETLERFAEAFAPCGFRREAFVPCYGLAEATLLVSGSSQQRGPVYLPAERHGRGDIIDGRTAQKPALVACGLSKTDQQVVIVDPETLLPCPPGKIGEIWVTSPSVAQGYWQRPAETGQVFGAQFAGSSSFYLRSGDLGLIQEGHLFVAGRIKEMIIIRGQNYYPQDIELTVEKSHPALQENAGAVFSTGEEPEQLVIVHEIKRGYRHTLKSEEVVACIRRQVMREHGLSASAIVLLRPGGIAKTSSGKIQRYLCRDNYLAGRLPVLSKWQQREHEDNSIFASELLSSCQTKEEIVAWMIEAWATRLGCSVSEIDANQPLISYGIDSLMATEFVQFIEEHLQRNLPLTLLLDGSSITQIAQALFQEMTSIVPSERSEPPVDRERESYPLTFVQQGIWSLDQLGFPPSVIVFSISLQGALKLQALEQALHAIMQRHAILRARFSLIDGEPIQFFPPTVDLKVPLIDLLHLSEDSRQKVLQMLTTARTEHSFDLEKGNPLHMLLFQLNDSCHDLFVCAHHIVFDAWSIDTFTREFVAFYRAYSQGTVATLPPLLLNYGDCALWQRAWLQNGKRQEALQRYWQTKLRGAPLLELPTDVPRPPQHCFRGMTQSFTVVTEIKEVSRREGVTPFMTLLTALQVLLYYYTGQDDLLVGTSMQNHFSPEMSALIGCFTNILPIRVRMNPSHSLRETLRQVSWIVLDAYTHKDLPFELLVEQLHPHWRAQYNPLLKVVLIFHQQSLPEETVEGVKVRVIPMEKTVTEYDLLLRIWDHEGELTGWVEYNAFLFHPRRIQSFIEHFQRILSIIVESPEQRISSLLLLSQAEQERMLMGWNATRVSFPDDHCLHELLEIQVHRTPDAVALFFGESQLTYEALEARAQLVANHLHALGIGPESLVGVCMERSFSAIIALLGVLKSGGAYLPLDPAYPAERLAFMLDDAQVEVVLTQKKHLERVATRHLRIICLDADWTSISQSPSVLPKRSSNALNLAYVIYTSGSTGFPKGIAITHRGIVNNLLDLQSRFSVTASDRILALSSFSFDMSVYEMLGTLLVGGSIVLLEPAREKDPTYWLTLLELYQISIWNSAPRLFVLLVEALELRTPSSIIPLRLILLGGDWIPVSLPTKAKRFFPEVIFVALGGATEASIHSTIYPVEDPDPTWKSIPYGRPMANQQAYILNESLFPVAVGITGKLYLGGVGLARGYFQHPEYTAEKFIPHPFSQRPGERLYETGDMARYWWDGTIELLGRIDHQVKLRGLRIELSEITTTLNHHPHVQASVVCAARKSSGEEGLVAYVVPRTQNCADVPQSFAQVLRHFLLKKLPEYMIPGAFVMLERIPLSPNGKVDYQALPHWQMLDREEGIVTPRTPIEGVLVILGLEIFGLKQLSTHDNFFELGANSLSMARLLTWIDAIFHIKVPFQLFFETSTIGELASNVEVICQETGYDAMTMARILLQIHELSEDEILRQLAQR